MSGKNIGTPSSVSDAIRPMFALSTKDFSITDTNNISPNILITE